MFRPLSYKGRSIWKGNFISFIKDKMIVKRNQVISKYDIGKNVYIYTGRNLILFEIDRKHVGYKYGQFIFTKRMGYVIHPERRKKKKKN